MWASAIVPAAFGLSSIWLGAIAAVVGLCFWVVGLYVLHLVFERYVRDAGDGAS
ncbi:MAG: hypothetical protein ACLFMX_04640 [Halobacteriales archaeon]